MDTLSKFGAVYVHRWLTELWGLWRWCMAAMVTTTAIATETAVAAVAAATSLLAACLLWRTWIIACIIFLCHYSGSWQSVGWVDNCTICVGGHVGCGAHVGWVDNCIASVGDRLRRTNGACCMVNGEIGLGPAGVDRFLRVLLQGWGSPMVVSISSICVMS